MKLATPSEMKKIDQLAIEEFKIPAILLMENAALSIAAKAEEMLGNPSVRKKTVIISGKGNNGGDAFAAARHLHQRAYPVSVVSLVPGNEVKGEAETYLVILENMGVPVIYATDKSSMAEITDLIKNSELIVDGIFGTGFYGDVKGHIASVIRIVNDSDARILSIDIPSGVNGKTGQKAGIAVEADETVTFSLPKPGICQYPGAGYAGKVTVADIGIPSGVYNQLDLHGELLEESTVSGFLPVRKKDGHKGSFGKVLIITGSTGMTGAGALAARAAYKTGSGLVYLAVPESLAHVYGGTIFEAITVPLQDENGSITANNLEDMISIADTMDTVVIGPGLSVNQHTKQWAGSFIMQCQKPMVIDADALNIAAYTPEILRKRKAPAVVTPHPGEFARLVAGSIEEVQMDRVEKALGFGRKYDVTVVLKGAGTVIACPDGKYYINATGNPGLAVAGSGDVLAGIIGSLMGQGVHNDKAAALGVFIHGKCGDYLSEKNKYQAGFLARDLCGQIPHVMGSLNRMRKKKP